jgi:hypothetical protein
MIKLVLLLSVWTKMKEKKKKKPPPPHCLGLVLKPQHSEFPVLTEQHFD